MSPPNAPRGYRYVRQLSEPERWFAVWQAVDREGRDVAVKFVPPDRMRSWSEATLRREACHLRRVRGTPCVQRLVTSVDRPAAVVTELVRGVSMARCIVRWHAAAEPVNVWPLFAALAEAVGRCHAAGLVHRDLKPSNVLVSAGGDVTLIDFGSAIDRGRRGVVDGSQRVGTVPYSAPELAECPRLATPATDVYALGILLRELLGGSTRVGDGAAAARHLVGPIERATALRPEDRFANVSTLIAALRRPCRA